MVAPITARLHKRPRIQGGSWRRPPRGHSGLASMRDISFPRVSLKSLQHHLILAKKIKTMTNVPQLRKTTNNHNQSGQIEFELLKSQFLGNISHELRTPLTVITGHLSLLLDGFRGNLGDEVRSGLTQAMNSSYHMLGLVNNLLDFTYLSGNNVQVQRELVDLEILLKEVASKWEERVKRHSLVLLKEIPPSLPQIKTDKNKLEKILNNLLDNALKFTPEGKVVFGACSRGDAVEITVADTGIGISKEAQQIVFDEFRQVDGSDTRAYQGMGLGLGLSKKLVRLLGGRIDLESEVARGSTFRVILPRESQNVGKDSDCRRSSGFPGDLGLSVAPHGL